MFSPFKKKKALLRIKDTVTRLCCGDSGGCRWGGSFNGIRAEGYYAQRKSELRTLGENVLNFSISETLEQPIQNL